MKDEIVELYLKSLSGIQGIKYIYLFGSRCRDDWKPDSDYDFLIVLEERVREVIDALYEGVVNILISYGKVVSLKIFNMSEFIRLKSIPSPFISNVLREGIKLG